MSKKSSFNNGIGSKTSNDERFMTVGEVSIELRVSERTLARWRSHTTGPEYVKLGGGGVRYERKSLESWIETNSSGNVEKVSPSEEFMDHLNIHLRTRFPKLLEDISRIFYAKKGLRATKKGAASKVTK